MSYGTTEFDIKRRIICLQKNPEETTLYIKILRENWAFEFEISIWIYRCRQKHSPLYNIHKYLIPCTKLPEKIIDRFMCIETIWLLDISIQLRLSMVSKKRYLTDSMVEYSMFVKHKNSASLNQEVIDQNVWLLGPAR